MRRLLCLLCSLLLAGGLWGCAPGGQTVTYMDTFDTVCRITAYGAAQEDFDRLHGELVRYHRLFDIYNTYEGISNLKTINEAAGQPVTVGEDILDLLAYGREMYTLTDGQVNILLGTVLELWHTARVAALADPTAATLPSPAALQAAATHTAIDAMVIDRQAGTVQLTDPAARLDVGALAKGFVANRLAAYAREQLGWTSALLDIGGNVCAVGGKGNLPFTIGIQHPDVTAAGYLATVQVADVSVVTSGDYQRYFEVDGTRYHHIIDPTTLQPATPMRAVTVIATDSAMADALSTALFTLPLSEGQALLSRVEDAEAVWMEADGTVTYSDGFEGYMVS